MPISTSTPTKTLTTLDRDIKALEADIDEQRAALQTAAKGADIIPRNPSASFKNLDGFLQDAQTETARHQRLETAQTAIARGQRQLQSLQKQRQELDRDLREKAAAEKLAKLEARTNQLTDSYLAELAAIVAEAKALKDDHKIRLNASGAGVGRLAFGIARASLVPGTFRLGRMTETLPEVD